MQKKKSQNIFKKIKESINIDSSNELNKQRITLQGFLLHLHPTMIQEKALKLSVTWGLGGMAVLLLLIQALTGILLRFIYQPSPEKAYDSILYIKNEIFFGDLIRNIHYWSGTFLVVVVFMHLLRVYFTGAYHNKRQFNWVLGVFLFLLVLFSNFTGYLLPWDQLAFWAITVSTSMLSYVPFVGDFLVKIVRGGSEVGEATLLIFYNFHTGILPMLILTIIGFHFWRVRKAGGVAVAKDQLDESKLVTTIPNLILREFVVALILIAFVMVFALLFNAPLLEKANPAISPNPAKAPWYFAGVQELMLHFHPLFSAIIIPLLIVITLIFIPYIKYDKEESGVWFLSDKGKITSKVSAIVAFIITPIFIIIDEYLTDLSSIYKSIPMVISNGVVPFVIIMVLIYSYYRLIKKKYKTNKDETFQSLFMLILVVFILLSVIGAFFRGEGMMLTFPWI